MARERDGNDDSNNASAEFTKEELERAVAPLTSLIGKSEKAKAKLAEGSWQHAMLDKNLRALSVAMKPLSSTST